jgi:hypothetical protein
MSPGQAPNKKGGEIRRKLFIGLYKKNKKKVARMEISIYL